MVEPDFLAINTGTVVVGESRERDYYNGFWGVGVEEILVRGPGCASVDEAKANSYREMVRFYSSVVADRYRSFVERHDLMRKFMAEDKAGAR
jgi:hypothetical protein